MTRPLTPRQLRKARDAAEVLEFKPPTHVETLRDSMDVGTFTQTGWAPPPHLSADSWLRTGVTLLGIERALPWCWGDWWLARGSRTLPADWTGHAQHTLDNAAIVARAYIISRRRENVSFKHHAELTALPEAEQEDLLDWCAGPQRPSVAELRQEKQRRAAPKLPPSTPPLRIEPLSVTPPPAAEIEPPIVQPPTREIEPPTDDVEIEPPIGNIEIRVELFLSEHLHTWAADRADNDGMSLAAWIVGLVEKERTTS